MHVRSNHAWALASAITLSLVGCAAPQPIIPARDFSSATASFRAPSGDVMRAQGGNSYWGDNSNYGGSRVGATSPGDAPNYGSSAAGFPPPSGSADYANDPLWGNQPQPRAAPPTDPGAWGGAPSQNGTSSPYGSSGAVPRNDLPPNGAGAVGLPSNDLPPNYTSQPAAPNYGSPYNSQPGGAYQPLPPVGGGTYLPPPGPVYNYSEPENLRPIDIEAIVRDGRTGRLMIGAGINSDAGVVGSLVIDEQNFDWRRLPTSYSDLLDGAFRGGGQRLRLEAQPGTYVERYMISFQDPYWNGTNFSFGLSGFYYDRNYFDWDESRTGGRVSLGYQLPEDWSISTAFRGEEIDIHNPRVVPPVAEVAEVVGSNTEYGVKMILAHDTRDNAFIPTTGHSIEVGFEQVFGDFQYPIATLDARQYFTVYRRGDLSGAHVLSVGGSVGVAGDDTPVYANFYAGGYSTLRGFAFRGASPKNGDVIVGGEFQLVGTVEYMFPITADNLLRGVVFCDAGTIEEQVEIKTDALRVAPGVGLRIAHPGLGPAPIALDLAFPVMHEEGDSIRNFIFFIGVRH